MGLEEDLQHALRTKTQAVQPLEDLVDRVHSGMRRRRRHQRLAAAASSLGVVAIAVAATLVVQAHTPVRPPVQPAQLPSIRTVGPVPDGFQATDLSYLSKADGFASGTAPCLDRTCTILLHTTDGGVTWSRLRTPHAETSRLRFAKATSGRPVGYAFGPGLAMSTDGGATWVTEDPPQAVEALEAANGSVVRVLALSGGGHLVQQAAVGSNDWRTVLTITATTHHAELARQGDRLVLVTYDNNASTAVTDVSDLRYSTDGGSTWTKAAHLPCDADSDFDSVALGAKTSVVVLCTERDTLARSTYIRLSDDQGGHFGTAAYLPHGISGTQVVAPAKGGVIVAGDVRGVAQRWVLDSLDQGATWRVVARSGAGPQESPGYLDISDPMTITWIGLDARFLWRSTDAGLTWTRYSFG